MPAWGRSLNSDLHSGLQFYNLAYTSTSSKVRDFHLVVPPRPETQHAPTLATSPRLLSGYLCFLCGATWVSSVSSCFLRPAWFFCPVMFLDGVTLRSLNVCFLIMEPALAYTSVGEPPTTMGTSAQKLCLNGTSIPSTLLCLVSVRSASEAASNDLSHHLSDPPHTPGQGLICLVHFIFNSPD